MNKNAIQRFAIWARTELIAQVSQRAYQYDITADGCGDDNAVAVGGRLLTDAEKKQRRELIDQIRSKGYAQVMEEVAYTWFNRFIALRFMEVNNYLPTHVRVFSDASGAFKPEILSAVLHLDLDGLDMEKVSELIEKTQTEDLYRYLLLTQCNALSPALPRMFETMDSYTELLLPNNILRPDGILGRLVTDIPEEDWTDQVQIIGWLYQYYNTELKNETFSLLKKNVKITKERLPSATQLFTPDWIVRYMVENSLGRLWIEGHPDDELKAGWKYYLEEAEQEPEVQKQLEAIRAEYRTLRPQDIKVIDPCMGSGHILVYCFDVLVQIYKKAGYSERDAAQSILENNLYGLDIDDRAAQLAYFAVMMKARQYDRRIFTRNIQPHVYAIEESNGITSAPMHDMGLHLTMDEYGIATKQALRLVEEMYDAREYGSIIQVTPCDWNLLRRFAVPRDENGQMHLDIHGEVEASARLQKLINIGEVLSQRYSIVVTNPPYMSVSNASANVQNYVKKFFPDSKADLFAVFIERCHMLVRKNGYQAMITQQGWMFVASLRNLREKIIQNDIINMCHLGARAFDEISGEVVSTSCFVSSNRHIENYTGMYCRLLEGHSEKEKEYIFLEKSCNYSAKQSEYYNIPGTPIAYWIGKGLMNSFKSLPCLGEYVECAAGITTGDNDRYLKLWFEIDFLKIAKNIRSDDDFELSEFRYAFCNKGGGYRKWYGNGEYVADWRNSENFHRNGATYRHLLFIEGITWSEICLGNFSARYYPSGYIFDHKSPGLFVNSSDQLMAHLAFLNSKVVDYILGIINPTISAGADSLRRIPFNSDYLNNLAIKKLARQQITESKTDWDSFETSWDFLIHPMVPVYADDPDYAYSVQAFYNTWKKQCQARFDKLKANEEELNRIFIDIYGLQDELTPEVADRDVTVRLADLGRDIRSLISYAVGCMFGRYSANGPVGLIYAGGEWDPEAYGRFKPDEDNIIPICDDEYFDDDIVGRFVQWLEIVYGKRSLEENLKFIADALGGKGAPRDVIRNYFLNDFYADHLKIYQKRPIYWLFDSGKKNGFKALIYMHRYQSDLLARMRTDYVHEQQERYRTQLKHIGDAMDSASASERVKLAKQQKKLQEQALELQKYEEKIHHLADQNIEIDLDDGVKVNYAKFADVLAKIK